MVERVSGSPSDLDQIQTGRELLGSTVDASVVGAIATGIIERVIVRRRSVFKSIRILMGTTGTAGQTNVTVNINGVAVPGATASLDNAVPDGSLAQGRPNSETVADEGQLLEIEVIGAATNGADLTVQVVLAETF